MAEGLEAAHKRGIIHRDLKPGNIKITPDGNLKILDFGLAKTAGAPTGAELTPSTSSPRDSTQFGVVMGTVGYMSPEQARGQPVDQRTDIWAYGCVLFEMCAQQPPFAAATVSDALNAVVEREPAWERLRAGTPANIVRLLRRCLTKDPKLRLPDIGEARIALERAESAVAVLPFTRTLADEPSAVSAGLHEEVIAALGQIDPRRLRVLARRSTMAYAVAGMSAAQIGRKLGADYLIDGVIREEGANWHFTYTVVNVRDEDQVSSKPFAYDRSTLPYLQTEVARAIARQIGLQLSAGQDQALVRRQAGNPQAYEHYLRGRTFWAKTSRDALFKAIDEYKRAIALDPEYALAYAGLADAYSVQPITSDLPSGAREGIRRA